MVDARRLKRVTALCFGLSGLAAAAAQAEPQEAASQPLGAPARVSSPDRELQSSVIPLRVEVNGTRDCPSREAFLATIVERTAHARAAEGGEMAWSIELFVEAKGRSRLAQLIMRSNEGPWVKREVLAPNCRQALDALSLAIAILVETAAEQAASLEQQASRSGEAPRALAPLPEIAAGMWIPWIDDPKFFDNRGVRLVEVNGGFSVLFGLEADQTLLPDPNFEYFAGLEWSRWVPDLISPSYSALLAFSRGDVRRRDLGEATVSRLLLRTRVCPADFIRSLAVELRPCVRLDGGLMWYETSDSEDGTFGVDAMTKTAFVTKLGPEVAFSVAPHPGIQIRLDLGIDLLLTRPPIEVQRPTGPRTLYRPEWNNAYAGLGVGVGI